MSIANYKRYNIAKLIKLLLNIIRQVNIFIISFLQAFLQAQI